MQRYSNAAPTHSRVIDLFGIQSSQERMMTPHLPTSTRNAATREVEVAGARKAREKTSIQWRRRMMKSIDLYIINFS